MCCTKYENLMVKKTFPYYKQSNQYSCPVLSLTGNSFPTYPLTIQFTPA